MKTKREYKFYTHEKKDGTKKVIAVTHDDWGKVFKGIATCMPGDVFNLETGKNLATLRCELKIEKRNYRDNCKFEKLVEESFLNAIENFKVVEKNKTENEIRIKSLEKELKNLLVDLK